MLELPWEQLREIRGMKIAYVPQDPGRRAQPGHPHRPADRRAAGAARHRHGRGAPRRAPGPVCARSACPTTTSSWRATPHQLSGGQVQRVALAMAFLPRPKVLVLDEPTTGLDVTTQGMVLQTMGELCRSHRVAALYVTHDLAVVANIADRVAVMYAGQIIELGPRDAMFRQPAHPYTRALLDAIPHLSQARALTGIPGSTPGPGRRPTACRFNTRCEYVEDRCREIEPEDAPGRPGPHREVPAGRRDRHLGHQPRQHHRHRPAHRAGHHPDDRRPQGLLRPQGGRARRQRSTWPRPRWSRWSASPAAARPRSRAASAACTSSGPAS